MLVKSVQMDGFELLYSYGLPKQRCNALEEGMAIRTYAEANPHGQAGAAAHQQVRQFKFLCMVHELFDLMHSPRLPLCPSKGTTCSWGL